jgi:hypothetical protein
MSNKSIICSVLFATGAITCYLALAKYVINRLIHGLFHIALVIIPQGRYQRSRADNKGNMKKAMY